MTDSYVVVKIQKSKITIAAKCYSDDDESASDFTVIQTSVGIKTSQTGNEGVIEYVQSIDTGDEYCRIKIDSGEKTHYELDGARVILDGGANFYKLSDL